MKIATVGMGYVGLTLSVLLAQKHDVIGLDIDLQKVEKLNDKICPYIDHELEKYFLGKDLKFMACTYDKKYFEDVDCIVIAIPTDFNENKGELDTEGIESIIVDCLNVNSNGYIVIKSTVPIGFTNYLNTKFHTNRIIFSPEFLREGKALLDNLFPSRIILGGRSDYCQRFGRLLSELSLNEVTPTLLTNSAEAEAIKLFSNLYLAMRIAFFNEIDSVSIVKGLNTKNIIEGICSEERIGEFYNNPSFGYGGYCLPKDTKHLLSECDGLPTVLLNSIVSSNQKRSEFIATQITKDNIDTIGIYRLLAKKDSDNIRDSSTENLIKQLAKYNVNIIIYEPLLSSKEISGAKVVTSIEELKKVSDVIVSNRVSDELSDVLEKVYTRDIFNRD
ncbi:nucleotide sugar dehydrogenase [Streptococcus hyointestinalis]|uniref:nucleotide sugar dehydrogenase n=1 Tax=Streptococcus hyointestinalis TaxID=1337 RepID=UPI003F952FB2